MKFRDLLPGLSALWADTPRSRRSTQRLFPSYDAAVQNCAGYGYETAQLTEIIFQKTAIYRSNCQSSKPPTLTPADSLALFGVGLAHGAASPVINVIDHGGACGAHYFLIKSLVGDRLRFRWHVAETPMMAARAEPLQTAELKFFGSIEQAAAALAAVDLVYSSGTLSFVPDPQQALMELLETQPRFVVLARLGMTLGPAPLIMIHEARLSDNGPGPLPPACRDAVTRYPYTLPVQADIEATLTKEHRILLQATDPSGILPIESQPVVGVGYVAERRGIDR